MSEWYAPVVIDNRVDDETGKFVSHIFRAGVPDDVYAIVDAWWQEEVEEGCWKLTFKEHVTLTAKQKKAMRDMGCKPVAEGKPDQIKRLRRRADALADIQPFVGEIG